jgi:N-acetylneuraminic acid mutarotase
MNRTRFCSRIALFLALALGVFAPGVALAAGTFSPVGSMATPRENHTATLLINGKVLVVGGDSGGAVNSNAQVGLSSAEIYDPATLNWTPAGSLATGRTGHTATLLPNGKVLVTGGANNGTKINSAELYDPSTNTWSYAASFTYARTAHTAALLQNGKVLIVDGILASSAGDPSAEIYDPATNKWAVTGAIPKAGRDTHTETALPNGTIIVSGGGHGGAFTITVYNDTEIFNPVTSTWSAGGNLTTTRAGHTGTLLPSGKILIAGGQNTNEVALFSAELYDTTTNGSALAGSFSVVRESHTASLLPDGTVLAAGGGSSNGSSSSLNSTELYDPSVDRWTYTANAMNATRQFHTATVLPSGNVLLTGGGDKNGVILQSAEQYIFGSLPQGAVNVTSGNSQVAPAGTNVSATISVHVTYQSGVNVPPGTTVTFTVASGGGSITGGTTTTDFFGNASLGSWTLGSVPGNNTLSVTAASSAPLTINATGLPGAPATMAITAGNNQSATAGSAVPIAPQVQVKDSQGNNVADGTTVTFTVASGGGSVTGGNATTAAGIATLGSWTLGNISGSNTLTVACGAASAVTFTATATPGLPATVSIMAGNNQTTAVGNTVPIAPSVLVQDAFKNNVANGTAVTFALASGGGSITGANATTLSGIATLGSWQLGTVTGTNSLNVKCGSAPSASITATATPGSPSTIAIVTGNNQSAAAGTPVPLVPAVLVQDGFSNNVADGTPVKFVVTSGGGSILSGNMTTHAGVAAAGQWTMGKTTGPNALTVTSGAAMVNIKASATVNTPPVIASGPTATPSTVTVRQPVSFAAVATDVDHEALIISWIFGDGSTGTGASINHIFTAPGVYTVSVSVLDAVNPAVTGNVQVTVLPAVALVGFGPDSDGDGFSDAFETAMGTNPSDAASTPTGQVITAADIGTLNVTKLQIKLNFAKAGNDSIMFGGTVNVPQGFVPAASVVYVDVGGVGKKLTLGSKGSVKQGGDSFVLALKVTKGVVQAVPAAKFTATFSKGSFAAMLATTSNLANDDLKNQPRTVAFTLIFNNAVQQAIQTVHYTAKSAKSGLAK